MKCDEISSAPVENNSIKRAPRAKAVSIFLLPSSVPLKFSSVFLHFSPLATFSQTSFCVLLPQAQKYCDIPPARNPLLAESSPLRLGVTLVRCPQGEVVAQQLHDEGRVLVRGGGGKGGNGWGNGWGNGGANGGGIGGGKRGGKGKGNEG